MSWMQKLYETYERCAGKEPDGSEPLMPISHTRQQAQIEVVLDASGGFRRASAITDKEKSNTLIPCTEDSGGRSGKKPVNHPLCDKLQYVAGDFLRYGGEVTSGFAGNPEQPHNEFLAGLRKWAASEHNHLKVEAVLRYVERGRVVEDLVNAHVLPVDAEGKLLKKWEGNKEKAPAIFGVIQNAQYPEDAFVRWQVEARPGEAAAGTWQDESLVSSWIAYYGSSQTQRGCCMVTGREAVLAGQHPAKLRHGADKAKLISSNDTSGYTFRGRLAEPDQVASVAFEVSQKAHNALRWLIDRQAYRSGDQAVVAWAVSGAPLPNWFDNTAELLGIGPETVSRDEQADTAEAFGRQLARAIAGYGSRLEPGDDIIIMGLDSATPGRMSITFYRELKGSEFLHRVETWHQRLAWPQTFRKDLKFVGCASPKDIAEAAYGRRLDERLRKSTVERLLPCIADARPIPPDLIFSAVRRASNRAGFENYWEWQKCLGIACSLFKGHHTERNYEMALEHDRKSRDYLYGRLLAVAENVEGYALSVGKEKRDTTAARYMQRFADRPASTWRGIELALRPYMSRLRQGEKTGGFLYKRERLLDEIINSFQGEQFNSDEKLTGEFLLGYHCQRQALFDGSAADKKDENGSGSEGGKIDEHIAE